MAEAFLPREEWALQRPGEENEPAVARIDRAEQREALFGQTCPIETAVDVPCPRRKEGQGQAAALLHQRHSSPAIPPPPSTPADRCQDRATPARFRADAACLTVLAMVLRKPGLKLPIGVAVLTSMPCPALPDNTRQDDPAGEIQSGATTLHLADGKGQPVSAGQLRRHRKEEHCVRHGGGANDDTDGPCLAGPDSSLRRAAALKIEEPDDLPRLKHCRSR